MKSKTPLIGCHVSIREGYYKAAVTAARLGAKSFQYFPKNPRGLSVKAFDRRDAERCADFCKEQGMPSIAHTPYPTNLAVDASASREQFERTVASLVNDLQIADACGSVGAVVHFGIYKGQDPLQGYKNIIHCLNTVLYAWEGAALLLIENQSGDHAKMGMTLEELVLIRNLTSFPEKIGFCFDTCHAFASGIWTGSNTDELLRKGQELQYWEHLRAVHLNDSKYPAGSHRDRHENIGNGHIGAPALKSLLAAKPFGNLPAVLETPVPASGSHREEIEYALAMAEGMKG